MSKLTDRQEMFCQEYLVDLNATQAAIRAGYSKKTARQVGAENLSKPYIAERLGQLKAERVEKVQIDAAWVLTKAKELHDTCVKEEQYGTAARALEIAGKHTDVQAFVEKVDHTSSDGSMSTNVTVTFVNPGDEE